MVDGFVVPGDARRIARALPSAQLCSHTGLNNTD